MFAPATSVPVTSSGPWFSSFCFMVHLYWLEYCSILHKADAPPPLIRMRTIRKSSNIKYRQGKLLLLIKKWQQELITQSRTEFIPSFWVPSVLCLCILLTVDWCSTVACATIQLKYVGKTWKCWFLNLTEAPSLNVAPLFTLWSTYRMAIIPISIHPSTFNPNVPIIWKHILNQLPRCYPASVSGSSSCGGGSQRLSKCTAATQKH